MKSKKLKKLIAMTIIATTVAANMPLGINSNVAFASELEYTTEYAKAAGFTYSLINGGSGYEITRFDNTKSGDITIPAKINGISVTSIGGYAFYNCSGLTSINVPSSVKSIGNDGFYGCSGLTSINIPSGVTSIGNETFYGCSGLTSIDIPSSVTSIGNSGFYNCSGLTSINVPSSVKSIGNDGFYGCSGLTSINIPSGVTSISNETFYGCSGLTSISIPSSVTSIGNYGFAVCSGLTSIDIQSSVISIGDYAFYYTNNQAIFYVPNDDVKTLLKEKGYPTSGTNQKIIKIPFNLIYDDNNSTGGSAPTDSTDYTSIQNVAVADNTGNLVRTGYIFDGWNTADDGSGTSYAVGDVLNIAGNTTLYAKWKVAISTAPSQNDITVTNNIGTSDTIEVSNVPTGATVKVYNAATEGIEIGSATVDADGTVTITCDLGAGSGNAYVTITETGKTESSPRTGKSYVAEGLPAPTKVVLAEGSLGTAGDNKITGLTSGSKYKVKIDSFTKYVRVDGTLSSIESEVAPLDGTEILGLTNGILYNVEKYSVTDKPVPSVTEGIPTAIKIKGTTEVGNTLSAEFVDVNGNSVTTSAAVTYKWYSSSDNSETGDLVGNDATYQLTSSDVGKNISLVVLFDDKKFKSSTSKITNKASSSTSSSSSSNNSSSSSSSSNSSSSSSNTEEINVAVTDGSSNNSVSKAVMERTTASDGTKKDTIDYTESKAQQTVEALKNEGKDIARIIVPDTKDEVSEDKINISTATISVLSKGNVKLEIDTENARISLSKESIQDLSQNGAVQGNGDLYFRLVPVKDEKKQQEIETIANQEQVVRQASGNSIVEVLGRPMQIETNMSNKSVDIILPLKGVILPNDSAQREAFLKDLGIFIEHSDGEKVLARGEIVEYAPGVLGLKFTVNKFSTFSIVKLNQKITGVGAWQNTAEGWKYIKDGKSATGWNLINGYWYLMNSTGVMETGWRETKGTWYLLNNDGAMETGWQQTNGHWYLLNTDGGMMMGWQKVNGQWYYLYEDGSMASDTTINGYGLDSNGAWIK